ncbi:hypothetical protein L6270_03765 [Candidatus Parcubacteria bacterium]|nr:hypothetical protein [Patescibacteria group bacterium]MBU4309080.1 hypothetical protein [Patescibacteria group bacterium]MBU4577441.1 hypothetical protein [Patescibacteria group bacterium]MCG2697129.1 hypothetical protein [Candidatus Parcubacteria bacterium]
MKLLFVSIISLRLVDIANNGNFELFIKRVSRYYLVKTRNKICFLYE